MMLALALAWVGRGRALSWWLGGVLCYKGMLERSIAVGT